MAPSDERFRVDLEAERQRVYLVSPLLLFASHKGRGAGRLQTTQIINMKGGFLFSLQMEIEA